MKTLPTIAVLLLLVGCTGCPAPTQQPAITIVGSDGSTTTVSLQAACQNVAQVCGVTQASCEQNLTNLQANTPEDLVCAQQKTTKADVHACPGIGSACPLP
jgi:hypothetical protein